MTNPDQPVLAADNLHTELISIDNPSKDSERSLIIVGLGASAGGLEALEQFFIPIPVDCGLAFVVIQHLDPNHKGMLPELLQRVTPMAVSQAKHGVQVKANCVYVIPPNKDLSIQDGKLQLLEPSAPRGLRLPIDLFLKALAKDQHENAVGIILSGMGADGTLGLQAIKENAGYVLVQTPTSAKFDPMPCSAIAAGLADEIAPPHELWHRLNVQLQLRLPQPPAAVLPEALTQSALEQIVSLLKERTGNDFKLYKKNTIFRRIERRMGIYQLQHILEYVEFLRQNPHEIDLLFKELLIGVTNFFRNPQIWEQLKFDVLPTLFAFYPAGKEMRAWVAACSTGEEAYSLAMIFVEALAENPILAGFSLQIFATDLDKDAIDRARQALYPATIASDVSAIRLEQFFIAEADGYRIKKNIREMVIFAQQNIITDPPFTKLDILSCRNLLIYFGMELQKKLLPLFHYALNNQGILLLGNAESICNFTGLFAIIDSHARLFRRINEPLSPANIDFPTKYSRLSIMNKPDTTPIKSEANLQTQVEQLLLQKFSPAAVLVNAEGDILFINGRTGKYLEPAAGKANWNIHAMARDGLRRELAGALHKAKSQTEPVILHGLTVGSNGNAQTFNLTVQAIDKPEALHGMLIIIFADVKTPVKRRATQKSGNAEQQLLLAELTQAQEDLQTWREEMQTSQEELKSSNEELQSTNEELQSTNEELTTSKEEMQSLNEELQTTNAELQSKVTDLSWVNNDMKNLLNSMEIATIFLDNALNIRRFTSHATHLFKLIASDVGRPLSDIVTQMDYPQLHQDAEDVLQTLVFSEKQIKAADGCWFKVRIMPYRTQENVIDGVVITLIDITETKNLEAELRSYQHCKS